MNNSHIPGPVLRALEHVRQFHPEVDRVVFWSDTRWMYSNENHEREAFGPEVDVGILEDAAAGLNVFPCAFQMEEPEQPVVLSDLAEYLWEEDHQLPRWQQLRNICRRISDGFSPAEAEPEQRPEISPGPWSEDSEGEYAYLVEDGNGEVICDVLRGLPHSEANARVISRVPQLLNALLYYRDHCTGCEPSISLFHRLLEQALEGLPGCGPPELAVANDRAELLGALAGVIDHSFYGATTGYHQVEPEWHRKAAAVLLKHRAVLA